ncbi:MAG: type III-B CRISPR module RAMP protein Cmr1 [Leptospiraceae bacterium]|nr:MAG: type III-B CRISPR module RAMP protein Cmr1 [Leptospiraceae bacterium]
MHKLTFECEVLTPLFMYGANSKEDLELRTSEIKGMMRFWWRAIMSENNIEKLQKEEGKIFGSTDEKSKFMIRIRDYKLNLSNYKYGSFNPLPHKENLSFKKMGFIPRLNFNIEITIFENNYKVLIENIFILTTILGGFGNRSRRGFGSIKINNSRDFGFEEINYKIILQKLNFIRNTYQITSNKIQNISKGGGNYPWIKEIEIGKNRYNDYNYLLKKIGDATHLYSVPSLDNANPRMASPIYVSVIENNKHYYPIITTLNSVFPSYYPKLNIHKQSEFKNKILQ